LEKRGTIETIRHTRRKRHTWKNAPYLEKCATHGIMRQDGKNVTHVQLKKYDHALEKVRQHWKNAPDLQDCSKSALGKMRHT